MRRNPASYAYHLVMLLMAAFFLFPFLVMLTTVFKADAETYTAPVRFLPRSFTHLDAFRTVFTTIPFFTYLLNTMTITTFSVLGAVVVSPMVAYSLARLRWRGRRLVFVMTLVVLMIPGQVLMIQVYMIFARLGMVGTFLPLILPSWLGSPFYIFLLHQFFKGLPRDLEDAGRIDGAGELAIYLRLFLPLCKSAILTILVFELLGSWNDFMGPLIYLTEGKMYTLQIGLSQFQDKHNIQVPPLMAASALTCIPILVLFFFAQRQFIEGITFSGIKG